VAYIIAVVCWLIAGVLFGWAFGRFQRVNR
jgi:uncharacterized BrkB/YihY/UPF0761 family membrane protein